MAMLKRVCFTLNNYTEQEEEDIGTKLEWSYLVIGREVGKEGTPHLQCYGELQTRKRLTTLKKFNTRIHWEALKSTAQAASKYCKKDGDFKEWGELALPAAKKDFAWALEKVQQGGMRKLLDDPPSMTTIRVIEKWLTYKEQKRTAKPEVTWLWGPSGAGKSRKASELAGEDVYWKDNTKWWDGYDGQECTILDDFRATQMQFTYLLKLLDRYPMRVEVKGGYRQMSSSKIIITSILHPEGAYQITEEPIRQLIRRIDTIEHVTERVESEDGTEQMENE
nr:MAG: replication polyprotein [Owegonang virus 32]